MTKASQDPGYSVAPAWLHGRKPDLSRLEELFAEVAEQLAKLPNGLRQTIADHQWATINLDVEEIAFNPTLAVNTPLNTTRQVDTLIRVTTAIVILPTGASGGTLQLGNRLIPVVSNPQILTPINALLATNDKRTISYTTGGPGPVFVWLMGQQLPTYGVLGG